MAKLPLEGIRVIENADIWIAPVTGHLLADWGAEVLKVEAIQRFSTNRGPSVRPPPHTRGYPNWDPGERPWNRFNSANGYHRNKRGFTLDLTRPKGVELYLKLAAISDVIFENWMPGVLDRLGVGYEAVKKLNPGIVYVSMSLFGQTGPYRNYTSYGSACETWCGGALLRGYPDEDPTRIRPQYLADPMGASRAVLGILGALHYRTRTGKGQYIDLSMSEHLMPVFGEFYMDYFMNGRVAKPIGNRHPSMAPHGCYRCRGEDRWVVIAVGTDEEWKGLCRALGNPPWTKEERFADALSRWKNQDELDKLIEEWTSQHDDYEAMHILQQFRVPAAPVVDGEQLYNDVHLWDRGYYQVLTHPEAGTHPYYTTSWKMSKTPSSISKPAPCLGEDNEYVFGEILGLSKGEMAELEAEQYIGTAYLEGSDL